MPETLKSITTMDVAIADELTLAFSLEKCRHHLRLYRFLSVSHQM